MRKFNVCAKCVRLKMIPHVFCSKNCFQTNWKIHKKEHQEFSSFVSERLKLLKEDEEEVKHYKRFQKLCKSLKRSGMDTHDSSVIYRRMKGDVSAAIVKLNLNKAETLCRKISKMYPLAPEPYIRLGHMRYSYCKSSHLRRKEAAKLFEISMVKTAHLLLNENMDCNFSFNYKTQTYEFITVLDYII